MNQVFVPEIRDLIHAVNYHPAVSIFMPFEPKMHLKAELKHSLKVATNKVEEQLHVNYPKEIASLMMHKLSLIISELNFNTNKNSIAIFISPVFEKILYLDIKLDEKIVIDDSFEIRDLIYSKKQDHKYLALTLGAKESGVYLGNSNNLSRIVINTPNSYQSSVNNGADQPTVFSALQESDETVVDKFLQHLDNSLDIILKTYHLPLFVLGPENILIHFKKLTKHAASVIEFIPGDDDYASNDQIIKVLAPFIADWRQLCQRDILNQLEDAAANNKLAVGLRDVWHMGMIYKGRLLVVEKDYVCVGGGNISEENICKVFEPYTKFSYIKDAVDDVIEKVLENGGDVEFVEEGFMKNYHHIALIQY